jgi:DNA-binding transcriptional ArsR family regulator
MTKPRFDELIHAPTRLAIVSLLAASEWAEFRFVRDTVALSDSALSKQLATLEEAGYVEIRKWFVGRGAAGDRVAGRRDGAAAVSPRASSARRRTRP